MRCGAEAVHVVYRRRQNDMTALDSEIEAAVMEGIDLMTLQAPKAIEKDEDGSCAALITQPQMIGPLPGRASGSDGCEQRAGADSVSGDSDRGGSGHRQRTL